jgi:hypothetical protein
MSFWKSLFGGGRSEAAGAPKTLRSVEHAGYLIEAQPYPEAGQYQVAGTISKTIEGARKVHRFVRADRFATIEDAAEVAITKGRQIVDQQGDRMFAPRG